MNLRKSVAATAASLLVAGFGVSLSAPAYAATASGVDPTGDITGANDITNFSVTFDHTDVTAVITTASALPALTDSSWANRIAAVDLEGGLDPDTGFDSTTFENKIRDVDDTRGDDGYPSENFGGFVLLQDGAFAESGTDHGNTDSCDAATGVISGNTITFHAKADCFGNLGSMQAEAVLSSGTAATTDIAISPNLTSATSVNASVPGGYYVLGGDGGVFSFGPNAPFYGSTGALKLNNPVVGMSANPAGGGYRFVAGDGGVFSYGPSTQFYGSMGGSPLNKPIVGMATTPDGNGYWLVASDGGIFAFGDAQFYGSAGSLKLNKPIVSMTATPDGKGYWLVASDGGIFAYGDAAFYGSAGSIKLQKPIVGMTASPDGAGYLLVASDGGTFAYGNAVFYGSGTDDFDNDVVGIAPDSHGGYDLVGAHGDVFAYGPAYDYGDPYRYDVHLNKGIVGMAAVTPAS